MGLPIARFDGDNNLEILKEEARQRKLVARQKREERRKARAVGEEDGIEVALLPAVAETEPEPEPEQEQEPEQEPAARGHTEPNASPVFDSPADAQESSEDSEDEDDVLMEEMRLEAQLERETSALGRNVAAQRLEEREARETMQTYMRDKSGKPTRRPQKHHVPQTSAQERLEFMTGNMERALDTSTDAAKAYRRWWWQPMPNPYSQHISLAIHSRPTLADRLLTTYKDKEKASKPAVALSAAAREAAAREADELAREDTLQYLRELKSASTERREIQKKDNNARRWGKLRKTVQQTTEEGEGGGRLNLSAVAAAYGQAGGGGSDGGGSRSRSRSRGGGRLPQRLAPLT
jgi:hypothetical protein